LRLWQRCGTFYTFGFMDDVIFARTRDAKNRILTDSTGGGGAVVCDTTTDRRTPDCACGRSLIFAIALLTKLKVNSELMPLVQDTTEVSTIRIFKFHKVL